jgi:polyhydroxyalkanoate synthesis regulator phasin
VISAEIGLAAWLFLRHRSNMIRNCTALIALLLFAQIGMITAQEEKESGTKSLGDLFSKVKDMKVPDSVANLPSQISELKESYLETAKTVEELRSEVEILRSNVYALRKENEELRNAVGVKLKDDSLAALLKPTEISATELVTRYADDSADADERYRDKYLKVVGLVAGFEAGTQSIEIFLRAEGQDIKVRCLVQTGADLFVDVLPSQGRLISRNDRRTLLTVGQPVAIIGTCGGAGLNVEILNGRIDGIVEREIKKPKPKK